MTIDTASESVPDEQVRASVGVASSLRRLVAPLGVVVFLAVLWEAYKALGGVCDDRIPLFGWDFPIPTDDTSMPHLHQILGSLFTDVQTAGKTLPLWRQLFEGALFTAREASVGFLIGSLIGVLIAFVFEAVPVLGKALLPWILVTQTVPFIATAPMVVIWGGQRGWPAWISVAFISAYLVFFPVVINMRRGLASASSAQTELFRSYAASRTVTLFRLKVPVALPYLFAGLRLGATAAVVGAIVGELPSGQRDGVGRLLLTFTSFFGLEPERLFAAVAAAALLGLTFVGIVSAAERAFLGPRRREI
ncbi:MAG: ABC transporter permease subunit [Actinomycetota bacterium]|nr:ABC transporter permease subunit [Actinomycetota bacterium]